MANTQELADGTNTRGTIYVVNTWDVVHTVKTWRAGTIALLHGPRDTHADVASVDLTDRCRPTAAGMVPYMFKCPSGHDGTTRWLICHNFLKMVLADRLQSQTDHQLHSVCEAVHAYKTSCMVTTIDVAEQANACDKAHLAKV